ncbi:hypothetical protein FACS1894147_02910 [Spirochaetia bacterium]|nr:hypothetical protein FACS1894147_02910 [Spirochaetia bacterium]
MARNREKEQLEQLIELFGDNINQYKSVQYDESNTRTDFIDKFFAFFDWDMANNQGYSEVYREVVREDKVKIDGQQKAPDYSFRIGGIRKFFVEAKKPSVNIKDGTDSAFQLRRYAYTAKLPLSILTNFNEFAIYDTRIKTDKNDKASTARIFYCGYQEYREHFEFIYNIFSKDAILKGSFDKYVEENKNKKGTSEVDTELLSLVEQWRVELAKNIAYRNPHLSIYNLNIAVQRIIDRIMFLRIAEDKGIETEDLLRTIVNTANIYEKLNLIFTKANKKYDSGLFKEEKWIEQIILDDKVLVNIIKNLYYPECPYEFSVLPVEILGNIYEKFLGKTIKFRKVKDSHTVIIEEKPEVRKAGGVYYTPKHIVDYIVNHTVAKLIKNKTPDEIDEIKILDSSCGSGSLLVGAYQCLLDYHLDYYAGSKNKKIALKKGKIYESSKDTYKLTIVEKQRILTNNIFGVDIDTQAVEVSKLSLYLKLLENEGKEAEGQLFSFSSLTLLPSLEENIKCGNSLIANNFYLNKDLSLFDDDMMHKVNVFDWEKEFESIMKKGGFDCIIGNPPYIFARDEGFTDEEKEYYYNTYALTEYQLNTYIMFTEKAFNLLNQNGTLGFIIPNNWFTINTALLFRKFILEHGKNKIIVTAQDKVFADASIDTSVLIFDKTGTDEIRAVKLENKQFIEISVLNSKDILQHDPCVINFENTDTHITNICDKIKNAGTELLSFCEIKAGIKAYEVTKGNPKQTVEMKEKRIYHSKKQHDKKWIKYLDGVDVSRYSLGWSGQYVLYGSNLAAPRKKELFLNQRILVRQIPSKGKYAIHAMICDEYCINDLNSMIVKVFDDAGIDLRYLLAVINSRLISYWFINVFGKMQRKLFPQFKINELSMFPIKIIDAKNKKELESYNQIITLVDQMVDCSKKQKQNIPNADKKTIEQRIEILNTQIDNAIYKLYGLKNEEIKMIE